MTQTLKMLDHLIVHELKVQLSPLLKKPVFHSLDLNHCLHPCYLVIDCTSDWLYLSSNLIGFCVHLSSNLYFVKLARYYPILCVSPPCFVLSSQDPILLDNLEVSHHGNPSLILSYNNSLAL